MGFCSSTKHHHFYSVLIFFSRQKRTKKQGWSIWSEWSTCSRTCDGGVAYQLRTCNAQQGCKGDTIRYKICNMQPCPDQQDFRKLQCSAYDTVPYDGALFTWKPHYDYSEPCALACRGWPTTQVSDETVAEVAQAESGDSIYSTDEDPSVVVQLSDRVQDGTRCRPGSLDMCIQGRCQVNHSKISDIFYFYKDHPTLGAPVWR